MLSASSHEHVQRAVTKLIIGGFGIMFEARLLRKIACRNAVSTYLHLAHAWWKAESDNACDPPFLKYHCGSAVCIEAHHQRGAAALHLDTAGTCMDVRGRATGRSAAPSPIARRRAMNLQVDASSPKPLEQFGSLLPASPTLTQPA